jgi:hypothetical protein
MDDELRALALLLAEPDPSSDTCRRGVRQLEEAITGTVPVPVPARRTPLRVRRRIGWVAARGSLTADAVPGPGVVVVQQDTTAADSRARWRAGRPGPGRPLLLTGAASAVLAAGLAVALAVTPGTARPPGGGGSPAFAPAATAAAVLRNAALAALAEPAVTPRPDQFVYSKLYDVMTCHAHRSTRVDQAWLSVNGTHAATGTGIGSVTITVGGHQPASSGWACPGFQVSPPSLIQSRPLRCRPCTPADYAAYIPAYIPAMPTRPAALRAWLDRRYHVPPGPAGVLELLGITDDLLATTYLTPAQHVAMYQLLTQTPSLQVVPHASTVLGRTGIGVRWMVRTGAAGHKPATDTFTLIFNRTTYRLLGMNWGLGAATGGEALIKLAIVNKTGQLP